MLLGTIYSEQPPIYLSLEVQTAAARISIQVQLSYLSDKTFYILLLLFKYKELIKLLFSLMLNLLIIINMKYYGNKRKYTKTKAKNKNKKKTNKYSIHTALRQQPIRIQFSHSLWRTVTANHESSLTLTLSANEN